MLGFFSFRAKATPASVPPVPTEQVKASTLPARAIAYEKFGRWFDAEEPLLRAKERTDAGSSPFRHPRSELIAPLLQEAPSAFNNRKLHMRLPCCEAAPTGRRETRSHRPHRSGW